MEELIAVFLIAVLSLLSAACLPLWVMPIAGAGLFLFVAAAVGIVSGIIRRRL